MIDCTLVSVVQEHAEIHVRENRARKYSAAKKAHKENINELLCGVVVATFMVGIFFIGMLV